MFKWLFKTKDCDEYQSFWLILRLVLKITTEFVQLTLVLQNAVLSILVLKAVK